eukprot:6177751-Pleurochrysis_carterae.AAC.10
MAVQRLGTVTSDGSEASNAVSLSPEAADAACRGYHDWAVHLSWKGGKAAHLRVICLTVYHMCE